MEVGAAWYSLRTEDAQLRGDLTRAEGLVTGSGTKAGIAGGKGISKGLGAGAVAGGAAVTSASTSTAGKMTGHLRDRHQQDRRLFQDRGTEGVDDFLRLGVVGTRRGQTTAPPVRC